MIFRISLFESERDNSPKTAEVDWETLLKEFRTHEQRLDKLGGACWSPTHFDGKRGNAHAREVSLAVFDLDDCPDVALAGLGDRLAAFTYALHSTWTPGCYRLILPLAKPISAKAWPEVWDAIAKDLMIPADPACRDAARLYFLPSCPPTTYADAVCCENQGLLYAAPEPRHAAVPPPSEGAASFASENPASSKNPEKFQAVDLVDVRKQLKAVRKSGSARLVKILLEGGSLQDEYGNRDDRMNRIASILATAVTPPLPWEAALEILRPSLNATPQERPGHLEHWISEMEDMFNRARQRRQKADEKAEALNAALMKAIGRPTRPSEGVTSEAALDEAWKARLLVTLNQEGEVSGLKQVGANAGLILAFAPELRGKIRFNEVTKEIDIGGEFSKWSKATLDVEIANWLSHSEYRLNLSTKIVAEQLLAVARRNAYNPLAEWLGGLKWDGTKRLENFLVNYFGAVGDAHYLARVGTSFMIAAVARAMKPGCKVDNVMVLQGLQGIKKSTGLRILGGAYFSDTKFNVAEKDGRMMASRFWIIELSEMAAMKKAEVETLKSFFSNAWDDIRVPYGRVLERFLRYCVFVGSTNSEEFLPPDDQQRRYWPVKVTRVDAEGLERDRDQLWAEAATRYSIGEQWWLQGDDVEVAEKVAQMASRASAMTEPILQWWLGLRVPRPEMVTTHKVASEALNMLTAQSCTDGVKQEVGRALRALGFVRCKQRVGGVSLNAYRAPQELLDATKTTSGQIISMVKVAAPNPKEQT